MSASKRRQELSQEAEDDEPGVSKRVRWDNEETPSDSAVSETSHSEETSGSKVGIVLHKNRF